MQMCMSVCPCVCGHLNVGSVWVCACESDVYMWVSTCLHVPVGVCVRVCTSIRVHVSMCVFVHLAFPGGPLVTDWPGQVPECPLPGQRGQGSPPRQWAQSCG